MTTLTIDELEQAAGRELGTSDWLEVTQELVNRFGQATRDEQWIHTDPERAASGPFGRTIAHGYLTLAFLPYLLDQVLEVEGRKVTINYGIDRVRFPAPVPVGSRVRVRATVSSAERKAIGVLYTLAVAVEVEDQERPALVGEVLFIAG
jgi:acyl dehydratase